MYGSNIERLKRDSKEIKHYMKKIEKTGNLTLAYKLRQKYEYLSSYIEEIQEEELS
jgi:hypothetical protein